MVGRIAIFLVVVLGVVTVPLLPVHAASRDRAKDLQQVDVRLDKTLKGLRAAERYADQKHLNRIDRTTDQAIRLVRGAEQKVDKALAMVRRAGKEKLSKAQVEQIERLVAEARGQLRRAEAMIDRAAQKSREHKRLREMFKDVDQHVDAALKMIHEIVAGL